MNPFPRSQKIAKATLAGAAALGGGLAHGALIYQDFNVVLTDPDSANPNTDATVGAIHYDGSALTLDHTTTNGISVNAIDNYILAVNPPTPKTVGGSVTVETFSQGSVPANAGDVIDTSFVWSTSAQTMSGSETGVFAVFKTGTGEVGWVRYSYTDGGTTVTVQDAAIESTVGTPVTVGVVPEASSAALAALAFGMAGLRRRRAA